MSGEHAWPRPRTQKLAAWSRHGNLLTSRRPTPAVGIVMAPADCHGLGGHFRVVGHSAPGGVDKYAARQIDG